MAKIRVVLSEMSSMLSDALSRLIGTQPDMRVVATACKNGDLLKEGRTESADVLIVQGAAAPEPIASVIAVALLGLLLIDRDGQAGALTRIAADTRPVSDLSGERLLQGSIGGGGARALMSYPSRQMALPNPRRDWRQRDELVGCFRWRVGRNLLPATNRRSCGFRASGHGREPSSRPTWLPVNPRRLRTHYLIPMSCRWRSLAEFFI